MPKGSAALPDYFSAIERWLRRRLDHPNAGSGGDLVLRRVAWKVRESIAATRV
jgi:hypothetical protein